MPPLRRPVRAIGEVIEVRNQCAATVRVGNGYETLAHRSQAAASQGPVLAVGSRIDLEFNAADMGHARILPHVY